MFKSRSTFIGFLLLNLIVSTTVGCAVGEVSAAGLEPKGASQPTDNRVAIPAKVSVQVLPASPQVQVTLAAETRTLSWDERVPDGERFELPLLVLHRQGEAAPEAERTLVIHLAGLAGGTEVQIEARSMHTDVTTGEPHRETKRAQLPDHPCSAADPCTVLWTFAAETMLSDLYTLRIEDQAGELLWENAHPDRPDFVALDTRETGLDGHTVRVTYATLFPFGRGQDGSDKRLSPAAVDAFIAQRFLPIIAETWHTQFNAWGFGPIHPDWDADKVVEIFITTPPFALFDGTGIYTVARYADGRAYPERRLWWFSSSPAYDTYDSLENGYRALLAHEFFHMVQWNTLLSAGCSTEMWNNLFIEAQGKFAPSVQYPEFEILGEHVAVINSEYQSAARHYLARSLNASYRDLEADRSYRYDWAPYWRFLYEQAGGMGIVRAALEEMACHYDADVERALPAVMDAAIARFDGPFATFEESLVAFAEANYALRLENGRCASDNLADCANIYYDPNHSYQTPPLEDELPYRGAPVAYDGAIPASFGMDFIEIRLDRNLAGQPLNIVFQGEGRFSVQIWELGSSSANAGALALASNGNNESEQPRALARHPRAIEKGDDNLHVEWIPSLDPVKCDRLALIVVRLDADGETDDTGSYTIILEAAPRTGDGDGDLASL